MVADLYYLESKADGKAEIIAYMEEHLRWSDTGAIGVGFAPTVKAPPVLVESKPRTTSSKGSKVTFFPEKGTKGWDYNDGGGDQEKIQLHPRRFSF